MRSTNARAAAVLLVAGILTACTDAPVSPPVPPTPGSVSTPAPGAPERALPVYYVADTAAGLRLYREFHRVPTADPPSDAVREMLARPTGIDPHYRSAWPPGTQLRTPVTAADGVITVDLGGPVRDGASVGSAAAEMTVQQLVYTVQGALQSTEPVRLLVDGEPVPELWGTVRTADPIKRADAYAVRSLVQIDSPADGASVGRDVVVAGEAAVFEATVPWEVLRDGKVVQSGAGMSAEGQRFSPFRFTVRLEPGQYVVRVSEDDPSGGAGRPVLTDDKTITVAG